MPQLTTQIKIPRISTFERLLMQLPLAKLGIMPINQAFGMEFCNNVAYAHAGFPLILKFEINY